MPRRTPRAPGGDEALIRARRAAAAADAKRAEDVVVLDLRGQTLVTDYFVICTGTSRVQLRAIVEAITEALAAPGLPLQEGDEASQWVLLDYGDVVVHVFGPETRAFYRLERLWGDAPEVPWRE
ncbi:MAG: ribosome silencing factor [Armatimonadota bacterium]|nr:ribosome silencing factor [Armatimonadota bacterium]MDR7533963.1 ribosome silencing factor [Armatimonadota bacterium]MDR7536431.1 ribosome silencing factor [Armatimonadota bacterium]